MKETKELIKGAKALAIIGAKVFADGKANALDLPKLAALVAEKDTLIEAVKGVNLIDDEMKELIECLKKGEKIDEACELLAELWAIGTAVKEELKK